MSEKFNFRVDGFLSWYNAYEPIGSDPPTHPNPYGVIIGPSLSERRNNLRNILTRTCLLGKCFRTALWSFIEFLFYLFFFSFSSALTQNKPVFKLRALAVARIWFNKVLKVMYVISFHLKLYLWVWQSHYYNWGHSIKLKTVYTAPNAQKRVANQ